MLCGSLMEACDTQRVHGFREREREGGREGGRERERRAVETKVTPKHSWFTEYASYCFSLFHWQFLAISLIKPSCCHGKIWQKNCLHHPFHALKHMEGPTRNVKMVKIQIRQINRKVHPQGIYSVAIKTCQLTVFDQCGKSVGNCFES